MTSRIATLIHTRYQHRNRRVTAGVMLTTVAIAAVVLFLTSTVNARAAGPCDGLSPVVVTATGSGTTSGSSAAPSANCSFSVDITPPAPEDASGAAGATGATAPEPCTATVTPIAVEGRGAEVEVRTSGNCDGVQLQTSISVGPPSADPAGSDNPPATSDAAVRGSVAASSLSYSAARSKITAWHRLPILPDVKMFWHYARVTWSHTLEAITRVALTTDHWGGGCGWSLDDGQRRTLFGTRTEYRGTNGTDWTANCPVAPDATADSVADVFIWPGGGFRCRYDTTFKKGVPGFAYNGSCLGH